MKNHKSDFDSPFGNVGRWQRQGAQASCAWCDWIKSFYYDTRKKWSAASRARFALQKHALSTHKEETKGYQR